MAPEEWLRRIREAEPDADYEVDDLLYSARVGELDDLFDDAPWQRLYSGSGDPPFWVGVQLGTIDESRCERLPLKCATPTDEQVAAARVEYEKLPEAARALLPPFGVYLVWSTS